MTDSLNILNPPMNASNNEIKKIQKTVANISPPTLGLTREEATAHFQMLNNANEFLRANENQTDTPTSTSKNRLPDTPDKDPQSKTSPVSSKDKY
jgi:hypothetical protein